RRLERVALLATRCGPEGERLLLAATPPQDVERETPGDGAEPGTRLAADLLQVVVEPEERLVADVPREVPAAQDARRYADDLPRPALVGLAQEELARAQPRLAQGLPSATARRTRSASQRSFPENRKTATFPSTESASERTIGTGNATRTSNDSSWRSSVAS